MERIWFGVLMTLVLVVFGGVVIFFAFGGGTDFLVEVFGCPEESAWPWCNENTRENIEVEASSFSTEILTCAVNAVILGEKGMCAQYSGQSVEDIDIAYGNTPSVECEYTGGDVVEYKMGEITVPSTIGTLGISIRSYAEEECKKAFGTMDYAVKSENEYRDPDGDQFTVFSCNKVVRETECTVRNFKLPQEVSDAEEWILGHGDPKYLVYWQSFPVEEDTWTYHTNWKVYAITTALFLIGPVKSAKALKGVATVAASSIKLIGKSTRSVAWKILKKEMGKLLKARLVSRLTKYILTKPIRTSLRVGGAAIVITASNVAEVADRILGSTLDKLEYQENAIALKVPFEKPAPQPLDSSFDGHPVMLRWTPESTELTKNLHFVSPCYLEPFKVKPEIGSCGLYTIEDGKATCSNPGEMEENRMWCDAGPLEIDSYIESGAYETAQNVLNKKNYKIFTSNENPTFYGAHIGYRDQWTLKELVLPWQSENAGKKVSLRFQDLEWEWTEDDPEDLEGGFACDTFLRKSKAKVLVDGEEKGDVVFECSLQPLDCIEPRLTEDYAQILRALEEKAYVCRITSEEAGKFDVLSPAYRYTFGQREEGFYYLQYWNKFTKDSIIFYDFFDHTADGYADDIVLNAKTNGEYYTVTISKPNDVGKGGSLSIENCNTMGVVAEMPSSPRLDGHDNNYCFRYKPTSTVVFATAGKVIGYAGIVVSGFLSRGASWAILLGTAAVEITSDVVDKYANEWP